MSPDGRVLLFSHVLPSRNCYYASAIDGESEVELTRRQYHRWPALSPNGRQVLSVTQAPGLGGRAYVVTSVDRRQTIQASDKPAVYPVWIDDSRLAYLHDDSTGGTEVRTAHVPTGDDRQLCRSSEPASWLCVDAAGRRIAVVLTSPDRRQHVVVRDLDAQRDTTVAEGNDYEHLR